MAYPRCCAHCQDYKNCDDRKRCCEFCDYCIKKKCIYKKDSTSKAMKAAIERKIEADFTLSDYRGDDYGIDDYEEYEIYDG
ncbi:MAG: hypothetical protein V1921_02105 [Candidatus Altiarchaeota archaeon]